MARKPAELLVSKRQLKLHGDRIREEARAEFGDDVVIIPTTMKTEKDLAIGPCPSCGRYGLYRRSTKQCVGEAPNARGVRAKKKSRGDACERITKRLKERGAATKAHRRGKVRVGKVWMTKANAKKLGVLR